MLVIVLAIVAALANVDTDANIAIFLLLVVSLYYS